MNAHRHVSAHLCVHSTPCPRGCRGEGISADFVPCFNYQPPERGLHTKMPGKHGGSRAGSPRAWQCLQPTHPWGSHLPATHTPAQPRDGTRPACHEQLPSQRTSQLRSGSQSPPLQSTHEHGTHGPPGAQSPPAPSQGLASQAATQAATMDPNGTGSSSRGSSPPSREAVSSGAWLPKHVPLIFPVRGSHPLHSGVTAPVASLGSHAPAASAGLHSKPVSVLLPVPRVLARSRDITHHLAGLLWGLWVTQ